MNNDLTLQTASARNAVLVDVDGTLCDVSGIRHYVQSDPRHRNFDKFHRASALCPAIPGTVDWVREQHAAGITVIIVTSRKQQYEQIKIGKHIGTASRNLHGLLLLQLGSMSKFRGAVQIHYFWPLILMCTTPTETRATHILSTRSTLPSRTR